MATRQCTAEHAAAVAGLYLPTSDIDLVVVNSGCSDIIQGLKAIATSLLRKTMAINVQVSFAILILQLIRKRNLSLALLARPYFRPRAVASDFDGNQGNIRQHAWSLVLVSCCSMDRTPASHVQLPAVAQKVTVTF